MNKFENKIIGIRSKKDNEIVAVYPEKLTGSDESIVKEVKDWYYKQSCEAGDDLDSSIVDVLSDDEKKSRNL